MAKVIDMNTKKPDTVRVETLLTAQAMSGLLKHFVKMSPAERTVFLERVDEKEPVGLAEFRNALDVYI